MRSVPSISRVRALLIAFNPQDVPEAHPNINQLVAVIMQMTCWSFFGDVQLRSKLGGKREPEPVRQVWQISKFGH